jgi:tRNA pseudouridine55 synthase
VSVDGVLVIDKPIGPTSHDVVARIRRVLRERRIGHTGTLDPAASGVLPLVIGRATRLARFVSAGNKRYEAVIQLGWSTDTGDAHGTRVGAAFDGVLPDRGAIEAALDFFRGTFLQQPPAYSAKKIGGRRSYALARAHVDVATAPAPVTAHAIEVTRVDRDQVSVAIECSAGFYVRSLAHDLGDRLGVGAHLAALRRTACGDYALADASTLGDVERRRDQAEAAILPLPKLLPRLPHVVLTSDAVTRARHGRELGPADLMSSAGLPSLATGEWIRLVDGAGDLLGLARVAPGSGLLHPSVLLM